MKYTRFFVFTLIAALTVVAAIGGALAAKAASISWSTNAVDQAASNRMNWDGGVVPVSGAAITLPTGSVVNWDLSGVVPSTIASAADLSLSAPLIVSGGLSLSGGSLKLIGQPLNIGGDLAISGALDAGNAPINVSGNFTYANGIVNLAATTVTLNGNGNKTITSGTAHFGSLTISSSGGRVSLNDALTVDGALSVNDGSLDLSGRTAKVAGAVTITGGTLSLSGGTLVLAASTGRPLVASGGTLNADAHSTVEYDSMSGSVAIEPLTYGNLTLAGDKSVFSLSGDTTVDGKLTIGAGSTLSLAGHALNVASGQIANAGLITDGTIHAPASVLAVLNASGAEIAAISAASGTITVKIIDQTLDRNATLVENIPTALTVSTVDGDKEIVALQETAPGSGIFLTAPLIVHQGSPIDGNNQIEIGQNDIVFVRFTDPQDPTYVKTIQLAVALASASASGQPQIVDGPHVTGWSSINTGSGTTYGAHLTWSTDTLSTSAVTVVSAQLVAPIAAGSLTGTTEHDVAVAGLVRGRDYSFTVSSVTADGKTVTSASQHFTVISDGDRIKSAKDPAVYWYLDSKRNVFSDRTVYDSWFPDFNGVTVVPPEQLAGVALGHAITVRAGTYLVKIQSDPKTYAVEPFGVLRWIPTEAQAIALYGNAWSKRVRDVDVSQFVNYTVGAALAANDIPAGLVYKVGNDTNVMIGKVAHPFSDASRTANGIASQFVSSIAPALNVIQASGGAVNGYDPDLSGVFNNGAQAVTAPAFSQ